MILRAIKYSLECDVVCQSIVQWFCAWADCDYLVSGVCSCCCHGNPHPQCLVS